MRTVLAVVFAAMLLAPRPSEACSPPPCASYLDMISPRPDAGGVPTNVQVLAWLPTFGGLTSSVRLERPDGGDGDGGVPFTLVQLRPDACSALFRLRPSAALLPNTDYRLSVGEGDGGEVDVPPRLVPGFFQTGDGPDLAPPPPPAVSQLGYHPSSCTSCGDRGGGASVAFEGSEGVWFAPLETKYVTNGGPTGFFVPFSCGIVSPALDEGAHRMPVIAFDSAWNSSDTSYVELVTNCDGLDPCTHQPIDGNPSSAPLRGSSGCGCRSSATLFALLASAVLARVLSRRR